MPTFQKFGEDKMYLQPQPRVWREMGAQSTVSPCLPSLLSSYASSGCQRRSWTRWRDGQYPGHFRGPGWQDRGSRPRSPSPTHTHIGVGCAAVCVCTPALLPPHHLWGADGPGLQPQQNSHRPRPLGGSLQSTCHCLRSKADFCPRYEWVAQPGSRDSSACPLGLGVTLYKTRMLRKTAREPCLGSRLTPLLLSFQGPSGPPGPKVSSSHFCLRPGVGGSLIPPPSPPPPPLKPKWQG